MPTFLCVPIMVQDKAQALADAAEAKVRGADLVEFRVDGFFHVATAGTAAMPEMSDETRAILEIVAQSPLPCIVTCRSSTEGGHFDGHETDRVSLYERLGTATGPNEHPPRFLDFELAAYAKSANIRQKIHLATDHPNRRRERAPSLILSSHDFDGRPADLTRRVLTMQSEDAAQIAKIAFRARSLRDNLELFEMLRESPKPMIALAMGECGLMSRVLAGKFGAFLTFASLRAGTGTAPGQPTIADLLNTYRFRSIGAATRVYGVIGSPVSHSLSPLIHNAAFEACGHDGVYLPLPIPPSADGNTEDTYLIFKSTLGALIDDQRLDFCGASVTLPHKESLVRFAAERNWEIDPVARAVGAANTLLIDRGDGKAIRGTALNSDIDAAIGPIVEMAGSLAGRTVAVVGAGGVARGIAFGLAAAGCSVNIYNRDFVKAQSLAAAIATATGNRGQLQALPAAELAVSDADIFVNATPIGMKGGPAADVTSIPVAQIGARRNPSIQPIVLDTVYNPIETPLVRAAKQANWRVIDGVEMFVRQAAVQSKAWTGRLAPGGLFDRLVRESLGG